MDNKTMLYKKRFVLIIIAVLSITSINRLQAQSDLVGYWKFNEGSGLKTFDSSRLKNDGTLVNMEESNWVAGLTGSALEFNDTDKYVDCGTNSCLALNNMTIEAWIYPYSFDSYESPFPDSYQSFISKFVYPRGYVLEFNWGGSISFDRYANLPTYHHDVVEFPAKDLITLNKWWHITAVDRGATLEIYFNGSKKSTFTKTSAIENTTGSFTIGSRGKSYIMRRPYKGRVDELKIYNRDLSPTEILNEYKSYITPSGTRTASTSSVDKKEIITIYSNMAEGKAQIEFVLAKKENVQINICNLIGEESGVIVNSEINAGTHRLDISNYLSKAGVYIIRAKAGNSVSNRKLINFR